MAAWRTRFRWLAAVLGGLVLLVAAAVIWGWWQLRGSLPPLDGERAVAGLTAPVKIERDAAGVPTLTGATRLDVARATGYLHAQDRFFQMDLLRRHGAGELSELFGSVAVDLDKSARLHGFRRTARQVVADAEPAERAVLAAYTAGVNAGLASLGKVPWEYLVLRAAPRPWREEDSVLCIYAMWFDLQDSSGSFELNRDALRVALGSASMDFLAPRGNSWDAALDGSTFAAPPPPALHFEAPAADSTVGALRSAIGSAKADAPKRPWAVGGNGPYPDLGKQVVGSNAFALAGAHTATGAALVANDMHLNFGVPHIWYRAVFQWTDATGPRRVVGVTLPGLPLMVVGSNGRVAWGFTDAYVDTADVITIATETTANSFYQTPDGWKEIEDRQEEIAVKGEKSVAFIARWTRWGPVIDGPKGGHGLVLRWTAHDAESTNLHFLDMENAPTTAAGVAVAHRASFPNENVIIGDAAGDIAWTILGRVPRRVGYDGRLPVSWGYGDRRWDGYLKPEEIPVVSNPKDAALWTANNRAVGGAAYAKLGDSGYDEGARGGQIRDGLRALVAADKKAVPADLLAIQLDDRALFLDRWQKFLLEVLDEKAVAANPSRTALRDAARTWSGHAGIDSVAYRVVRAFRLHVADRAFAPFAEQARQEYPAFNWRGLRYEDALWLLVHERPAKLLNPGQPSWTALLLAAADDITADVAKSGDSLAHFTWGARNTLAMQHPFGRFLPKSVARLLDMPSTQLPGDADMPRVLNPRFGQSERLVVSPGHEDEAIFEMPGGQSGHPLSPFYRAGHDAWATGAATPLLPGPAQHTLTLKPQ